MRPYRYQLLLLVVDVAFYALCMLLAPLLISFVVDNVIQGVPFDNGFLQNLVNAFGVCRCCRIICGFGLV